MDQALLDRLNVSDRDRPAYRQIADQVAAMIRAGELAPGERLPPDRSLARALGLSRTTVVTAYEELKASGLVHGRQGSGTYVARTHGPGQGWAGVHGSGVAPATNGAAAAGRPLSLAHAMPPLESVPLRTLTRLLAEAAQEQPAALAEYLPAEGYPPLRHELARLLAGWGLSARPAEIAVLSGSQQGIDLLARLFLRPGDYVAMEAHAYSGALSAFRAAGARLLPVPLDGEGMQVDGLASLLARYPVRFIYSVPTYQNPTGTVLPLTRRLALLEVAARQAVPIVEDSPFDQLYFDQPPPPSLKALDRQGLVLYLNSASKLLCSGLRLGWIVAPPAIIEQVATLKRSADLQANNFGQVAFQRFLAEGLLEPHLIALRQANQRRAERVIGLLRQHLPDLAITPPRGGTSLWTRLPDGLSAEAVLEEALARGVSFMPGSWSSINGSDDGSLRLCFTGPPLDLLDEAILRFVAAVRAVAARGGMPAPDRLTARLPLV